VRLICTAVKSATIGIKGLRYDGKKNTHIHRISLPRVYVRHVRKILVGYGSIMSLRRYQAGLIYSVGSRTHGRYAGNEKHLITKEFTFLL